MSELGNLSNCVVDPDSGAAGRTRGLRRGAFVGSLFVEASFVGALLLWPLLAPAMLPAQMAVTPLPPYRGDTVVAARTGHPREAAGPVFVAIPVSLHPSLGRPRSFEPFTSGNEPPAIGDAGDYGSAADVLGGSSADRAIDVPRPASPRQPLKVSAGVMEALLIHRVQPDYPALAKTMGLSGVVELQARIGIDGTVQALQVVSGNPILARAAIEAVEQWRYQPTRLSGQPVEVETHITVTFSLQ